MHAASTFYAHQVTLPSAGRFIFHKDTIAGLARGLPEEANARYSLKSSPRYTLRTCSFSSTSWELPSANT